MPSITKDQAVRELRELEQEVWRSMERVRKSKGKPSERAMTMAKRSMQRVALQMAIKCLSDPRKVISLPGADPAEFGGA